MDISNYIIGILLAFSRISAFLFTLPFLKERAIPTIAKVTVSLALSISVVGEFKDIEIKTLPEFITLILVQIIVGLTLAFLIELVFSGIRMAGALLDIDMGFSNAILYDHSSSQQTTVLSNILFYVFMVIFLSLGGLSHLIGGIVYSFKFANPKYFLGDVGTITIILDFFQYMLTAAVQIALPLMISSFILNIIMLVIGKSSPQLNLFQNAFAIKIGVGLIILIISLPFIGDIFTQINEVMFEKFADAIGDLLRN